MFLWREIEFFWDKVDKTGECWLWIGSKNPHGYGQIRVRRLKKLFLASRFSWILHNGKIPKGENVLHRCDNPACIRPHHLFLGSMLDNTVDMMKKGRHWTQKRRGFKPHRKDGPKLTEEEARQVKKSKLPPEVLSEMYGISARTVLRIKSGEIRKNL